MKLKIEEAGPVELDSRFINANFSSNAVDRLLRNFENAANSEMSAALDSAQREVDLMEDLVVPGLFTFDQKKAELLADRVQTQAERLATEEPATAQNVTGHNPNLFPPFFSSFRHSTVGGNVTTPIYRQRPEVGALSISVAANLPGGHISRTAYMATLAIAPSTEMVTAAVSTFVAGNIFALTLLGYGRASARLLVWIQADGPAGYRGATGTVVLGDHAMGLTRIPLTNMTATARLMVNAGDLLLVACGLQVTAGCGGIICSGASNIALSGAVLCLL